MRSVRRVETGSRSALAWPALRWSALACSALACSALALALAAGCEEQREPASPPEPDAEELEQAGEAVYLRYCALCHGRDGEGYAADDAPALANQQWLRSASDDFIRVAIAEGRPDTVMSAWSRRAGGPLNDTQIEAVIRYLRSWQRHPRAVVDAVPVDGDPARGRPIYDAECARCHGPRGEGVDAVSIGNPALLATASDGFLRYAVTHGRSGTRMPAFDQTLTPQQIDDVVAYVRSFERPAPVRPAASPEADAEPPQAPSLDEVQLVTHPDGERPDFTLREERFVAADDVHAAYRDGRRMILIDARATSDWLRERIPGAIPMPFYDMDAVVEQLPRDGTPIIAYCGCPHAASGRVVDALRRHGFTNTMVLDEGIQYWVDQGYPTSAGPSQP